MPSELGRVIEQVEKDKGIEKAILVEALETAMLTAAKKKYGLEREIEAHFNEDLGEIELFQFKTVVEAVANPETEVEQGEATKLDPEASLGDSIGIKLNSSEFGRIAAQTAKQVIIQKVRDAERDIIFKEFDVRKGEVVSGTCRRIEKGCVVVDLGRTDAILPAREQIPGETFRPGDRVLGYLIDVQQTPRGPKIVLSRTCKELLIQLFRQEVPEVAEDIVVIKTAAREPGIRAKIAVASVDSDVDPVGACVGVKGARVQNVVQELRGEKIDIVPWDADETRFVCNALAPAEVIKVVIDEDNHAMAIVVADSQLSLAIGKRGQNVKLASILSGWKLDILSETRMAKRQEDAKALLAKIQGMNDTIVQSFYQYGYSVEQIASAEIEALAQVPGCTPEKGVEIKAGAAAFMASGELQSMRSAQAEAAKNAQMNAKLSADQVFERLKAEVKAHEERSQKQEALEKAAEAAPQGDKE
ncbi:MAG: transcription termination/antitermination protein NusA [Deltaproteobacteria bacterium]|nr:transcription termination/antitermination protein NusA [Deltaproteobacteria bacterium]MBI3294309.1 transcription termination/antitermination protein NusA [Deltaproteobacteria bacterium]